MKRIALLLAVLSAVGVTAVSSFGATAPSGSGDRMPTLETMILHRLNAVRAANGLRPVVISGALQNAAIAHSRDMLQGGYFEHDAPAGPTFAARLRRFYTPRGFDSWSVAENLLFASYVATPAQVIDAWMASPGHRENMLSPNWREVGIGVLESSTAPGTFKGEPTFLVTMDFGLRVRKSVTGLTARS